MVGRKSKVLIDSIDLEILSILDDKEGIGVLELAEKINLTHQNVKTHLEKLIRASLILKKPSFTSKKKTNKIELITPLFFKKYFKKQTEDTKKFIFEYETFKRRLKTLAAIELETDTLSNILNQLKIEGKNGFKVTKPTENKEKKSRRTHKKKSLSSINKHKETSK